MIEFDGSIECPSAAGRFLEKFRPPQAGRGVVGAEFQVAGVIARRGRKILLFGDRLRQFGEGRSGPPHLIGTPEIGRGPQHRERPERDDQEPDIQHFVRFPRAGRLAIALS